VPTNAASAAEAPESVEMAAGDIARDDVLQRLGTGVYINNLWYLNYSDRVACRMTGMTRFATFWVEGGVIQAPLSVMRFDESIYRMLGDHLLGLTAERDFILDSSTYHERSTGSSRLPGALVEDFNFTL
jgi:predicted Zn-dependent protease